MRACSVALLPILVFAAALGHINAAETVNSTDAPATVDTVLPTDGVVNAENITDPAAANDSGLGPAPTTVLPPLPPPLPLPKQSLPLVCIH